MLGVFFKTRDQACWRRRFDWLLKGHMNVTSYGV